MSTTWEENLAMRIARLLGLSSIDEDLLVMAGARWESWVARSDGALDGAPDLVGLPDWLWDATPAEADRVLVHLAFLAARDGEDDLAAAGVLAWVLLPGAHVIVRALSRSSTVIDEVVAAQLWVQVRTFSWRSCRRVAANILRNTRKHVLLDLGLRAPTDSIWRRAVLIDPTTTQWRSLEFYEAPRDVMDDLTLGQLLRRACQDNVITAVDRDLLIAVARASEAVGYERAKSSAGLLNDATCQRVAQEWGCSPRSVRRRTRRVLLDLRAAYKPSSLVPA